MTGTDWKPWAARLAERLVQSGELHCPAWRDAIASVPRHELVPVYYEQNEHGDWRSVDGAGDRDTWLDTVYSDATLITALTDFSPDGTPQVPVSSSTAPGLMVAMLETLDIAEDHRVLEIGTGSGYNAGLLSHRLSSANVFTVDVDPRLVGTARERLAGIGYTPTTVFRDGIYGLAEYAPYDKTIATCAVSAVPRAWIDQATPGGAILVDFKIAAMAGNLVTLHVHDGQAFGHFTSTWAAFMDARRPGVPLRQPPRRDTSDTRIRRTTAPLHPWQTTEAWFITNLRAGIHGMRFGQTVNPGTGAPENTILTADDGSWCEISAGTDPHDGTRQVRHGGPTDLWHAYETAYHHWCRQGKPDWTRYGLTVGPDNTHTIWLDHPDTGTIATLP